VADANELQRQLTELQSQLAFQEHTVQSLNEALAAQQQEIIVLRRQLELLKRGQDEQQRRLQDIAPVPVDEKPPHY
jgi:SlyX protein